MEAAAVALVCSGAEAQDKSAVPVEAAKVIAAPLSEQVTAIGTLLSDEAVTVSSEIPGRLQEIHFQEGQPVEKGASLFTLDDSVYRAQLADAQAKLKLAEQTHKRTSQLFTNKYATAQSADESASNLAKGQPMREAVVKSATLRLRPILMTTGAMVLGAVPLALATGAGAESRQDIGWVIVGGLLVGTLFTLFVIPVVYTYVSRRVFIEADLEGTPETAPALPAPHGSKPREALEPAE